jgi:hypothetical protein
MCAAVLALALQHTRGADGQWRSSGRTVEVHSGQLGQIESIASCDPRVQQELQDGRVMRAAAAAGGYHMHSADALVLARVGSRDGPVVLVPAVTHTVPVIECTGCLWVDVTYLPLRAGWATTVTATQGLEFDRVLLDLNQAHWLPGGGYTGVGRVRGSLVQGLRIIGGFSYNLSAFNCSAAARDWFVSTILGLT